MGESPTFLLHRQLPRIGKTSSPQCVTRLRLFSCHWRDFISLCLNMICFILYTEQSSGQSLVQVSEFDCTCSFGLTWQLSNYRTDFQVNHVYNVAISVRIRLHD